MKSGYVYLTEFESKLLVNFLKNSKMPESKALLEKLNYYQGKNTSLSSYHKLALDKINQIDKSLIENEEVFIDDDALVSEDTNGAYVHAWIYVDNKPKAKRSRKKANQ